VGQDNTLVDKFKDLPAAGKWGAALAAAASLILLPVGMHLASSQTQKPAEPAKVDKDGKPMVKSIAADSVAALGRLEPMGEVVKVSAPSSQSGATIQQLLVKEGDGIRAGQVIAILDNRTEQEAALMRAEEDVKFAQSNLAKVRAGAKVGEIEAQKAQISRLESQLQGDGATYQATKARLESQLKWDVAAQTGQVNMLSAQLAGETPTHQATVKRLEAQLKNAQIEYQRYQKLYEQSAIDASKFSAKRLEVDTISQQLAETKSKHAQTMAMLNQQILQNQATRNKLETTTREQLAEAKATYDKTLATGLKQIQEAKATLNKIAEVRPVDVQASQAELARAQATARQAKAQLDRSYIKSPMMGEVLKVNSRPGEVPSNTQGIIELGQTSQMVAVAEVYESDVSKIKVGQAATIVSEAGAFSQEVKGSVTYIGQRIGKQDILNTDPAADSDSRVVEVKIKIDPNDSQVVNRLTNAKVKIKIKTESQALANPTPSNSSTTPASQNN
jgi:HlyD family secretion protein